ncbi:hypothetical protein [Mesorhizobium sp. CAU 1732]|uniref:hypothetical protein n=1 Tax=Mesorhizobium sp. CAU 1732 TaxID=3140358 RepID=UPI003260AB5A
MTTALRPALGLALTTLIGPALAEEVMTPQEFCAELFASAKADCLAAAELLTAPSGMPPIGALSVFVRADDGALSVEYRLDREYPAEDVSVECGPGDAIVLPAGAAVRLLFTSVDAIYTFEAPNYVEPIDLVPGRVNERLIETPAEAGEANGMLRADRDGAKTTVELRFITSTEAFDPQTACDG